MQFVIKWLSLFLLAASTLVAQEIPQSRPLPSCVMTAKDSTFAMLALNQKFPVLIYFTDVQQQACKDMEPLIEQTAREYANQVRFIRVDADRCPRIIKASHVTRLPYFCLLNRPARLAFNFTGILDRENLRKLIERGMNPQNILDSANTKYANKDYQGAITDFSLAIKINPKDAELYNSRGNARSALGDQKGALADFTQAITLNPENPEFYNNRGLVRNSRDDSDGAIEDFTQAVKFVPANAEIWNSRACAKIKKGDYKGAIADFTQAIDHNKEFSDAYQGRGMARLAEGDCKGAIEDFQHALAIKKNPACALDLWVARVRQGQRAVADKDLAAFFSQKCDQRSLMDECSHKIEEYFLKKISADNLLNRIDSDDLSWAKSALACSVYYYMGQEKLSSKTPGDAVEFFQKSVATGETGSISYMGSMAELARSRMVNPPPRSPAKPPADEMPLDSLPYIASTAAQKKASDFFRLGEMVELACLQNFYTINGSKRDRHYAEMYDMASALDASPAVLADIERIRKINSTLPSSSPFKNWLDNEKKLAATCSPNPLVWNQWLMTTGDDKYLYSWLGRFSLRAWLGVQKSVIAYSQPVSSELKNMQSIVGGVSTILTQPRYEPALQNLTTEAYSALKEMDFVKTVLDDSTQSQPSLSIVNAIGNAGRKLYEINKEGKLLKE